MAFIETRRVYEGVPRDGAAFFVERLWPRGITKAALRGVPWLKDVAPGPALRRWYGHDPARWAEFRRRYRAELRREPAAGAVATLLAAARRGPVTLLYAARDTERNSATVLKAHLEERLA